MDSFDLISSKSAKTIQAKKITAKKKYLLFKCIIISLFLLFTTNIFSIIFIFSINAKVNTMKINDILFKNNKKKKFEIDDDESYLNKTNEPFNNNIMEEYINRQKEFCLHPEKFYNQKYEKLIKLTKFSFRNFSYQMYVYNKVDRWISYEIIRTAKYEPLSMSNFLDILKYYSTKNNIKKNEDIFILDIGGNLGVYPLFLSKFGYSIITFEASPRNSYIIYKNYCRISNNSNIIIVNKGLSNEDKICNYYSHIKAIGNGAVLCNENKKKTTAGNLKLQKEFEIRLTKLSNFLPYLSRKHIA
jgi:FkbM family methyltransferase